tara:strand:- start:11 stop:316 length:306 start_codon:yes stop_codon:yes gene_type:complete
VTKMSWQNIIKSEADLIDSAKTALIQYINKHGMSGISEKKVEMGLSKRGTTYGKAALLLYVFHEEKMERHNLSRQQLKNTQGKWNSLMRTMDLVADIKWSD